MKLDSEWAGRAIEKNNASSCTMALGSTQPLTEMSNRNLPVGLRRVRLTTLPPSLSRFFRKYWSIDVSRRVMGMTFFYMTFATYVSFKKYSKIFMKNVSVILLFVVSDWSTIIFFYSLINDLPIYVPLVTASFSNIYSSRHNDNLWNHKFHYHAQKSPLHPLLSQFYPFHANTPIILKSV
jgi:hypothetical protein